MQSDGRMAVVCGKDSALAYRAAGVETFTPKDKQETADLINSLAKQNYAVILITEDKAEKIGDVLMEFKSKVYPIILPIPVCGGSNGLGMRGLKHNVEIAIGMDIVFNKEGNK